MSDSTDDINILHVDDDPDLLELAKDFVERQDERAAVTTAISAEEGLDELRSNQIDCIVSDFDMPGKNGLDFLDAVREDYPDLPFILYTGKGSEEIASEAISAGVTDYLQKKMGSSQYTVLANRIENAVDSFQTERALAATRQRYEKLVEQSLAGIYIIQEGEFVYVNPKLAQNHGYEQDEVIGMTPLELTAPEERDRVREYIQKRLDGEVEDIHYETVGLTKGGEHIDIELHGSRIEYQGQPAVIGVEIDITERKRRERQQAATIESLRDLFDLATDTEIAGLDKITRLLEIGPERFNLPYGHLTRIEVDSNDAEGGTQTIIEATGDHEFLQPGDSSPLSRSYCRNTIGTQGIFEVHDALGAGWENDPAYQTFNLGCYIGTKITVDNQLYGTVFLASETPREEPFTDAERMFVRLLGQLVEYELEQNSEPRFTDNHQP